MANTELVLGLAGIGGTVAAALSANGVTWLVERKKEQREDRVERGEVRRAARMVGTEIQEAMGDVAAALATRTLWAPEHAPSRALWLEHAPVLATNLTTDEYGRVARAYVQLKEALAIVPPTDGRELARPDLQSLELTHERLDEGSKALQRLAALE